MALSVACGSGLFGNADALSTTYVHSGLGFEPKALIVWSVGDGTGTTSWVNRTNYISLGFAASTSDRRSVGVGQANALGSMTCSSAIRNDACLAVPNITASIRALLDLQSFDADGFTLIVDDAIGGGGTSADIPYHWLALGGSDITSVATGEIAEPGATGNASYTAGAGFQPTVAFFGGIALTTAANSVASVDSGFMYGAATGTGSGNQFVFLLNNDEGSASADVDRYVRFDECVALMTTAGGNPSARASFNGFTSTGFDLNWSARTASTRRFIYLAIAAGSGNVALGKLDIPYTGGWDTLSSTHTVSGLAFQPAAVWMVTGATGGESAAGTSTATGFPSQSPGVFTSISNRYAMGYLDSTDGAADSFTTHGVSSELAIFLSGTATTTSGRADVDAITSDGFRLIVDQVGTVTAGASVTGYVAFRSAAPATSLPNFAARRFHRSRRVM